MKYVLWKVSNGWLMTRGTAIWEDDSHMSTYAVFHSLKEFSDYVDPQTPKQKHVSRNRSNGTPATKAYAGRIPARN